MKSLKDTGCPPQTKIYGHHPQNKGLLLLLDDQQEIGRNGIISGNFTILASGIGEYSALFRDLRDTPLCCFEELDKAATACELDGYKAGLHTSALSISGVEEDERKPLVFVCHASEDKKQARRLYRDLRHDGFNPWLDEEDLLPGQDWEIEIERAIRKSDAVVVVLSSNSVTKEGFVQKEIRLVLDAANEKPAGTIFILPALTESCVVPERLLKLHWVRLDSNNGYSKLKNALTSRAAQLGKWVDFRRVWHPGDDPLQARIDELNQEEVRAWLRAVGVDSDVFPEEIGKEWGKTYNYGWDVFNDIEYR